MEDDRMAPSVRGVTDDLRRRVLQRHGDVRTNDDQHRNSGAQDKAPMRQARGGDIDRGETSDSLEDNGAGVFRAIAVILAVEFTLAAILFAIFS